MSDDSWGRLPEAKVRIPEVGIQPLLDGLSESGFIVTYRSRVELVDDGIYVTLETNLGIYPKIIPFPIEIFIPVSADRMPKAKVENEEETKPDSDNRGTVKAEGDGPNQGDKGSTPQASEGTQSSVGEPTTDDIALDSDGSLGEPSERSGGLRESVDEGGNTEPSTTSNDGLRAMFGDIISDIKRTTP